MHLNRKIILAASVLTVVLATPLFADDADTQASMTKAEQINQRIDLRGEQHLGNNGDRIENRLDNRGDHIEAHQYNPGAPQAFDPYLGVHTPYTSTQTHIYGRPGTHVYTPYHGVNTPHTTHHTR